MRLLDFTLQSLLYLQFYMVLIIFYKLLLLLLLQSLWLWLIFFQFLILVFLLPHKLIVLSNFVIHLFFITLLLVL